MGSFFFGQEFTGRSSENVRFTRVRVSIIQKGFLRYDEQANMIVWDTYPASYRAREVATVLQAVRAGESVSLVGLSGAGKSNLLGFIANRVSGTGLPGFILLDCNRLETPKVRAFLDLLDGALGDTNEGSTVASLAAIQAHLEKRLADAPQGLCLLVDRLDILPAEQDAILAGNLRALRDTFKYLLTFVVATRRPLPAASELAELFYANTIWIGALNSEDARWSATQYAARRGQEWGAEVLDQLIAFSQGYPALLRAACEAYADGTALEPAALRTHPAVRRRVEEFWQDRPTDEALRLSGLLGHPWLAQGAGPSPGRPGTDLANLTAFELRLMQYFQAHRGMVCSKDDLIAAVWAEELHVTGLRDDRLAQLVRRLRLKIEPDPAHPQRIKTVPGRGYLWVG